MLNPQSSSHQLVIQFTHGFCSIEPVLDEKNISMLPSLNAKIIHFASQVLSYPFRKNMALPRIISPPRLLSPTFLSSQFRKQPPRAILQSKESAASLLSDSYLVDFSNWLVSRGGLAPSVKPGPVPEGLGLIAQRDISRNEVVVEVPKKLWIDADSVATSEIGRFCSGLRPWVCIALFLLRERALGDASPWKPYLDVLPSSTDSTIFWSEEELSQIQGTQLLSTTIGVKEYVQSEFVKVEEEIILKNKNLFLGSITCDDFLWAFGILRSRAFSRLRGDNLALIPFADLINHNPAITSEDLAWEIKGKGLFGRDQVFSLRAPLLVKSGEQVCIQYDVEKSNAELALDYGFIESNPNREVYTLTLEISESDPFYGDKLDIAESNGLGETAYFDIVLGHSLPPQLLPYLRLVALGGTDAFLLESIFRNAIWGHLELPLSHENEEAICHVVRDACKNALSAYATSVEEDEGLMESGNLDPRMQIAVGVRAGEKKVLQQIDSIFKNRELELDGLEYYQERRLKDLGLVGDNGEIIFWES